MSPSFLICAAASRSPHNTFGLLLTEAYEKPCLYNEITNGSTANRPQHRSDHGATLCSAGNSLLRGARTCLKEGSEHHEQLL